MNIGNKYRLLDKEYVLIHIDPDLTKWERFWDKITNTITTRCYILQEVDDPLKRLYLNKDTHDLTKYNIETTI